MALDQKGLKIKSDTAEAVRTGMIDRVAAFTKENYAYIRTLASSVPEATTLPENPSDQQFREYAAEMASKRSIGGIKLQDMDAKLKESENGRAFLTSRRVDNLSQLIPSNEQITAISNEVGEAVANNSPTTRLGKIWKGVKNLGEERAIRSVASSSATDTRTRLNNLAATRSDIARFMTPEAIAALSGEVEKGIIEEKIPSERKPKKDIVAETTIRPIDEATQQAIFGGFGSMVYDKTQNAINDRIESTRSSGFKGFMMRLLEIPVLGDIIRSIAGMLGFNIPKIPSQDEIHNVSSVVAQSTTNAVRENASRLSRTELVEVVRSTTMANLQANRADYSAFTDEQLIEMANSAAQGVNENYDRIPRIAPNDAVRGQAVAAAQPGRSMTQGGEHTASAPVQPSGPRAGQVAGRN